MFSKLTYKFEGFVDVLNGTFIKEIADLLESATAPGDKGKSNFEVDHTIEELSENIQKNFTDVPTFMKSLRASARQTMIRRLAKYSKDKSVWIRGLHPGLTSKEYRPDVGKYSTGNLPCGDVPFP